MSIYQPELDDTPYYVGQRITVAVEYRLLGVPTDPTIVQVSARNPVSLGVAILTYPNQALTRISPGLYEAAIQVTDPGPWYFRAEGVGVVDAVTETTLEVLASHVTNP